MITKKTREYRNFHNGQIEEVDVYKLFGLVDMVLWDRERREWHLSWVSNLMLWVTLTVASWVAFVYMITRFTDLPL